MFLEVLVSFPLGISNGLSGTTDSNKWIILFRKILMNCVVYG